MNQKIQDTVNSLLHLLASATEAATTVEQANREVTPLPALDSVIMNGCVIRLENELKAVKLAVEAWRSRLRRDGSSSSHMIRLRQDEMLARSMNFTQTLAQLNCVVLAAIGWPADTLREVREFLNRALPHIWDDDDTLFCL